MSDNKWQKGIPPKNGWYWVLNRDCHSGEPIDSYILYFLNSKAKTGWVEVLDFWPYENEEWIGPLEEPKL